MTKIQLATKAAWNGLFLFFFGNILAVCSYISLDPEKMQHVPMELEKMKWLYFLVFFCVCLLLALTFLFLRNLSMPLRLTETSVVVTEQNWRAFFIKANRLACVFAGIILLCDHRDALDSAGSLIVDFLPAARDWLTLWVEGKVSFALEKTFIAVVHIFYPFGFLAFCSYLVLGANGFIRWQIRLFEKSITKEPCNE
jgi:hypothetical protein